MEQTRDYSIELVGQRRLEAPMHKEVVWVAYAFVVQGLRRLGLDSHIIILREVTGCMLNAYFFLFLASTLMSYYLNNRKADERNN